MIPIPHNAATRTRVIVAAGVVAGAMLFPGTASASTDPALSTDPATLSLHGVAEEGFMPGCVEFIADDGNNFQLLLPSEPTRDQRDLIRYGIPLNVPMQVTAEPTALYGSYCMNGTMAEVQDVVTEEPAEEYGYSW